MSKVVVVENSKEFIEVITQGPQGVAGADGIDGADGSSQSLIMFIVENTLTQPIPRHDGNSSTEIIVDFGSASDEYLEVGGGVLKFLKEVQYVQATIELQAEKTGGSIARLVVWTELSNDSGATWAIFPDTLRAMSINNDSEGTHDYDFSSLGPFAAGTWIRVRATNDGGGNLALRPPSLVASLGAVSGKSSKLTMQYL
jgi:hypothetical protein